MAATTFPYMAHTHVKKKKLTCHVDLSAHCPKDSCVFHPGIPIFHDALKGWSCCRKRTTDFSEFLSIKGCTRGHHSNERPCEPLVPEVSSDKASSKHVNGQEIIYQGPKSAEKLKRERPSSDQPKTKLPVKVSPSLAKELEKLDISTRAENAKKESQGVVQGTRCKNAGCKTVYEGPETEVGVCTHHCGGPVFHEGYKYWSCCCIKTIDFNAFLDQKGCTTGKHCWLPKQDKKKVACRHDWHQTANNVVVSIYAKNTNPGISCIEANGTVVTCQIQFENDKLFRRDFHLWGVINVQRSSVNMIPSKVEINLCKADQVAWGKLEDPTYKPPPEPAEDTAVEVPEARRPDWDIDDDDISDSDEEWVDDAPPKDTREKTACEGERRVDGEDMQNEQRREVEQEMRRAMEDKRKGEEERRKLEELRRQEEEGYEEMPDLE
nr:cysteine and histidine-rich domain-containing protein 1-like isoform X1 [Nerophis lumbriciformis]